ncbi:MAG: glycosyltransferase family 8 protein [Alphaproteobacteria bacterium]|nr:glycosyltransferase family 8 protein [Alphaproteobacteria bacterium]
MSKKNFYIICAFLLTAILSIVAFFILYKLHPEDNGWVEQKIEKKDIIPSFIRIQKNQCSLEKKEVNITLITDSKYIIPTATSMYSAIKNKCQSSTYNFYIITENITKEDAEFLLKLKDLAKDTVNITLIPKEEPNLPFKNMERFIRYKVGMHKIFLPDVLKDLNKVIYMDGDTIVLKDLSSLYDINIDDVYASVAKDGIYYRFLEEMKEIGLDKRGYYFNSGVMLYNLDLQRKDKIVEKLIEYVNTNKDFYGDQDALNIVFGDKLKLMSYRYNCISTFFEEDDLNFLSRYHGETLPLQTFYIYENSTIIHYAGDKPWADNYKPVYLKELWFRYYNEVLAL